MTRDTQPRTEKEELRRRMFMKYGLAVSSGVALGGAGAASAGEGSAERWSGESDLDGLMFGYQFVPDASAVVEDADVDWRPGGVADHYRTNVVTYAVAPSYRAFLFTDRGFQEGDRFDLGDRSRSTNAGQRLVAVDVDGKR